MIRQSRHAFQDVGNTLGSKAGRSTLQTEQRTVGSSEDKLPGRRDTVQYRHSVTAKGAPEVIGSSITNNYEREVAASAMLRQLTL